MGGSMGGAGVEPGLGPEVDPGVNLAVVQR